MDVYTYTQKIFDDYEKKFMEALLTRPLREPWKSSHREEIIAETKKVLGIKDEYIPKIRERVVDEIEYKEYKVQRIMFESWENCYGTANLYLPRSTGKKPLIVICCGHGEQGKLTPGYQAMARRLARQGAYVLISDNIGQGERKIMGHRDVVAPFYCGISLQGLIVMETIAWINRVMEYPFVDKTRLGACGNSGGGTLTLFLAALCPNLAALSSSGYPSTFWWLGAKEKKHCHCNIIPHVLPRLEMWELYSIFAPKPLYLIQGRFDNMLPEDLFYKNARNVSYTYLKLNAINKFKAESRNGLHSWDNERRKALGDFFSETLGLEPAEELEDDILDTIDPLSKIGEFPDDAIDTDELAQRLTGIRMPEGICLWDVYKPMYQGKFISGKDIVKSIERGDTMQVLAQFEAFL